MATRRKRTTKTSKTAVNTTKNILKLNKRLHLQRVKLSELNKERRQLDAAIKKNIAALSKQRALVRGTMTEISVELDK